MLEIERKFLVTATPLLWPVSFEAHQLTQVYLTPTDPKISSERVRMSVTGGKGEIDYTHTKKVRISAGVHEEEQHEISIAKYSELLYRLDPDMIQIQKQRQVFTHDRQLFELDIFEKPFLGLMILEIELTSMDVEVRLPPWLRIEREVTKEPAFTNAALARTGRIP